MHPKVNEPGYWNGPQSQDWSVIGAYADEVRIMLYGYSWQTSPPGPISPVSWVNDVLDFAETTLPTQKIVQGIPTYGLDWPASSAGTEYMWDQLMALANTYGVTIKWDNVSMSPWFQYTALGIQHSAWFENASSTEAKLNVNNLHNNAGIFIWRLGGENPRIWDSIRLKFGGVIVPKAPTATIKAGGVDTSITIPYNTSTVISWSSTDADSCLVSGTDWTGTSNAGVSTGNLTSTTAYTLNCSGPGGEASDSVVVNVNPPPPPPPAGDTTAPTVSITEPTAGSSVSKRVKVSASASDDVKVTKVLFYIDNNLLGTETSAPYITFWTTQKSGSGSHTIKAVAYDAAGNTGTAQISVTVK
ncbi:MAG: hypothetical protein A3D56_02500 [Candidatus Taylorbacteria bacterium RIFCSPHIGHO2_02_FULL_45_35]|uniref:GH18 domain-containing protein n=1 Tax=Candidatus Taylorbacteria bacterium RIFCSPHIGHO2_02_FULL_45_35 TaxID=1802311 RepID=A0A1G2MS94_9BACT|nr:MAG: hypothetical protein A3D56_02500 [Candidatus Taylorbacteria bacterium RIFCSPHIGHO2_02_FULL_45_35]